MTEPPVKIRNIHLVGMKYYVSSKTTSAACSQGFKEASQHKTGQHIRQQMCYRTFVALSLVNPNHHALTIDISHFQVRGLRHTQACGVGGHQQGPMFEV